MTIIYHRRPTKEEISFGYGAEHFKEFPITMVMKGVSPNGVPILKKWVVCPNSGLRYYI